MELSVRWTIYNWTDLSCSQWKPGHLLPASDSRLPKSSQFHLQWPHVGRVKSTIVGIFYHRKWQMLQIKAFLVPVNWLLNIYHHTIAMYAKSLQLYPTLCDSIDGSPPGSPIPGILSPPGSPIPGILQARTLERAAISFSHARKWKVKVKSLSRPTQRPHELQPTRFLHPWDFPGKNTGVGCHCLLRSYY